MCSLLHDGSLPLLDFGAPGPVKATSPFSQHKGSHACTWTRLIRAASKPAAALEKLVADFKIGVDQDSIISRALEERKALLQLQLKSAITLQQWQAAATELDELLGNNIWKQEEDSPEYNHRLIRARLERLDEVRESCDTSRMIFLIRTALSRHLGGMSDIKLYMHSHIGTKDLIERYIGSALETLSSLLDITKRQGDASLDSRVALQQILLARQSFGRSALLLSGGGTFGMSHIGVVKCLWEQQLLPRIISGASAGSIVCSVLCAKTDDEIPNTLDEFCHGDLAVFTPPEGKETILTQVSRFLKTGAMYDIANVTRVMRGILGDMTFQEAYNRTRRIANITVSSASVFELPRLLNYVTAPNVVIWSAVAASCSVPIVFTAADLIAKDPRTGTLSPWNPSSQRWIDGSVDNDLPMTRLAEMFNVNHFIVSQVNPHVVPFLAQEQYEIGKEARANEHPSTTGSSWLGSVANVAREEAMHRMHVASELGILPNLLNKTVSILSQKYSGDITILPEVSYAQFPMILTNPTTEFMLRSTLIGERATWPKLSRIQNHCAIELALDDAVQHLRARIAFSPSQVDLRLNNIARPASRAGSEGRTRTQRKRLRFTADGGERTFEANSSRPMSGQEASSTGGSLIRQPIPSRRIERSAEPLHLKIEAPISPPIFTTGSEGDSGSDSDFDSAESGVDSDSSTPLEQPVGSGGARLSSNLATTRRHLFPHASQPSTPHYQAQRSSYFDTSSQAVDSQRYPPLIAPSTNLELRMTPAMNRRSTINLQEADGRRKKFAGSTPRTTSPVRTRDLVKDSESTVFGGSGTSSPRTSLETPRSSLERQPSNPDFDLSGTRGMLRRKKSSLKSSMGGLLGMSSRK